MGEPEIGTGHEPPTATASQSASRLSSLTYKAARRIAVAIVGTTLLLVGAVMMITPGPGVVVLLLALAVLSAEFAWARRWLKHLKGVASDTAQRIGLEKKNKTTEE